MDRKDDPRGDILRYVVQYKEEHDGVSPSLEEIRSALKFGSVQAVLHHLNVMEAEGTIYKAGDEKGMKRAICVTGGQWTFTGDLNGFTT